MSAERVFYLDSSAIVKLIVREPESLALRRYLRRRRPLVASALARAAMAGQSLSDFLLAELRTIAERPSHEELVARVRSRPPASVDESPEDVIRAERDRR